MLQKKLDKIESGVCYKTPLFFKNATIFDEKIVVLLVECHFTLDKLEFLSGVLPEISGV